MRHFSRNDVSGKVRSEGETRGRRYRTIVGDGGDGRGWPRCDRWAAKRWVGVPRSGIVHVCAGARMCVWFLWRDRSGAVAGVRCCCCWWCGPWSGRSGLAEVVSVGWRVLSALLDTRCGCMTLRRWRRADSEPIAQVVSQIGSRRGEGAVSSGGPAAPSRRRRRWRRVC